MVRAAALLRQNNSTTSRIDTLDASTPTGTRVQSSLSSHKMCHFPEKGFRHICLSPI